MLYSFCVLCSNTEAKIILSFNVKCNVCEIDSYMCIKCREDKVSHKKLSQFDCARIIEKNSGHENHSSIEII